MLFQYLIKVTVTYVTNHTLTETLDKNKKVLVVFGDISKAFGRVWHAGLLAKLNTTVVPGDLNKWFSLNHKLFSWEKAAGSFR